jgi:hypothetical protein
MSKLSKYLTSIEDSEATLRILQAHGLNILQLKYIRVDGTKAKVIKSVLTEITGLLEPETPSRIKPVGPKSSS